MRTHTLSTHTHLIKITARRRTETCDVTNKETSEIRRNPFGQSQCLLVIWESAIIIYLTCRHFYVYARISTRTNHKCTNAQMVCVRCVHNIKWDNIHSFMNTSFDNWRFLLEPFVPPPPPRCLLLCRSQVRTNKYICSLCLFLFPPRFRLLSMPFTFFSSNFDVVRDLHHTERTWLMHIDIRDTIPAAIFNKKNTMCNKSYSFALQIPNGSNTENDHKFEKLPSIPSFTLSKQWYADAYRFHVTKRYITLIYVANYKLHVENYSPLIWHSSAIFV